MPNYGIEVAYLDDLNDAAMEQSVRESTKAIYVESISNPTMCRRWPLLSSSPVVMGWCL